jgi:hypothetical protein
MELAERNGSDFALRATSRPPMAIAPSLARNSPASGGGWRREWESSNRFFRSLPFLSGGLQLFPILPLGAKRDLPLFSAFDHQFRTFSFRWHSKWHSARAVRQGASHDHLRADSVASLTDRDGLSDGRHGRGSSGPRRSDRQPNPTVAFAMPAPMSARLRALLRNCLIYCSRRACAPGGRGSRAGTKRSPSYVHLDAPLRQTTLVSHSLL